MRNKLLSLFICLGLILPSLSFVRATLQDEIDALNEKIDNKMEELNKIEEEIKTYEENIQKKQEEGLSLQSELETIEQDIAKNGKEIEKKQQEINLLELKIDEHNLNIAETETNISLNKDNLSDLIRTIYESQQKTYLEIFLLKNNLSDFSSQLAYLNSISDQVRKTVYDQNTQKENLQKEKLSLVDDKLAVEKETENLQLQTQSLEGEQQQKENLLVTTNQSEEDFAKLVENIKADEAAINSQISTYENKLREKLKKQGNTNEDTNSGFQNLDGFDPDWPTTGIITTYFHDPSYPFRRYFEHDAIDIAIPQGTDIKAVDDGYVSLAIWDGTARYSYVTIVHADNFLTLYGHLSEVYVSPDQYVRKGEVIGRSGGMPGTPGAGNLTTGPHLHFTIRLNSISVDPLAYLP